MFGHMLHMSACYNITTARVCSSPCLGEDNVASEATIDIILLLPQIYLMIIKTFAPVSGFGEIGKQTNKLCCHKC